MLTTLEQCRDECESNYTCNAIEWEPDQPQGKTCWIHSRNYITYDVAHRPAGRISHHQLDRACRRKFCYYTEHNFDCSIDECNHEQKDSCQLSPFPLAKRLAAAERFDPCYFAVEIRKERCSKSVRYVAPRHPVVSTVELASSGSISGSTPSESTMLRL